ncbi:unnamed protein product [Periconia digitata]|uniref:Inositol-1-monophosphatase n=1 Tax=Periconia digitata TaxID=1303443 RepID=A0A9W4UQG7_9PLEO|nr:unnamed protein product [Periconia digitata]
MADLNLQEIHDFMVKVAKEAADTITSARPTTDAAGNKKNSVDLVTETDQAVEAQISSQLSKAYPTFSFMGEETHKPGDALTTSPTFILDPIDGTTNFVHRASTVAISLGLAVDRVPTIGVIYNPFTRMLYTGIKGQGSYVESALAPGVREKLPLTPPAAFEGLGSCLVAVEWGSDRRANDFKVKSETFTRLAADSAVGGAFVHGLRSYGSAALNLCEVAKGSVDVYWEAGCWAWDVCAGWVILGEAGGKVVDANPGNWKPKVEGRRYLAVRAGEGQDGIVEEFWGHVQGRFEVDENSTS